MHPLLHVPRKYLRKHLYLLCHHNKNSPRSGCSSDEVIAKRDVNRQLPISSQQSDHTVSKQHEVENTNAQRVVVDTARCMSDSADENNGKKYKCSSHRSDQANSNKTPSHAFI